MELEQENPVVDQLHQVFVARAEEDFRALFLSPEGHRCHGVVRFNSIDAERGDAGHLAVVVGEIELGKEVFRGSFAVHFVFGVDNLARLFVVGAVENADEVVSGEVADQLLDGADKAKQGTCRLPLVVEHGPNSVIGTEKVIDGV